MKLAPTGKADASQKGSHYFTASRLSTAEKRQRIRPYELPANIKRAIRIMALYVSILTFLGVVAASYCLDRVKLWQGNTNFHNPINWNPPHVPCSASRVILPSDRKLVVMMAPETTVIREIVLPMNGEIILPSDGAIILDDKFSRNDNCKKEDVVYVGKKLSSWLDPNSWATRDNQGKDITVTVVPHAERIPCAHDKVVFPQGKSFRLLLPEVEVAVGSLSILGESLTTDSWREYAVTPEGRIQFIGDPATVTVLSADGSDHPCRKKNGCYCGTYGPKTMDAICSHVGGGHCELPQCLSPIQPIGHCCKICGATIVAEYNSNLFEITALENTVKRFTSSSVLAHVGKTSPMEHKVQILFVDADTYDGKSVAAAERLYAVLKNDMSNGLLGLQFKSSGDAVVLSDISIKDSPGKITGFIFGGFALAAVIVLLVIAYKDQRYIVGEGPSFMFSRFENAPSAGDGPVIRVWGEEVGQAAQEDPGKGGSSWVTMEPVLSSSTPQAFDNPMYNKSGMEEERKDTKAVMSSTVDWNKMKDGSGQSVTMENPVYSALSQKVKEEETTAKSKEEEEKKPKHTKRKPKGRKEKIRKGIIADNEKDNDTDSDTMTVIEELDS